MKNFFLFALLLLTLNISVFAQALSYELDKIREIKMLESTRGDVSRILVGYEYDKDDDEETTMEFSTKNIDVEIEFSAGSCSEEAEETDEWNVPKGKVKRIEITFKNSVTPDDLQLDLSDFKKEQRYANVEDEFSYYTVDLGISIHIKKNEVEQITIFPALKKSSLLCKNEENEEVEKLRKMYSNKSIFIEPKLEDRIYEENVHVPPYVADLILSENEITVSCSAVNSEQNKNCSNSPRLINVSATSNYPESEEYLVFNYHVSGGRIVGEGKNVTWDLADVKPGKYTITAGVDDGCGICGETKTQTVEVK